MEDSNDDDNFEPICHRYQQHSCQPLATIINGTVSSPNTFEKLSMVHCAQLKSSRPLTSSSLPLQDSVFSVHITNNPCSVGNYSDSDFEEPQPKNYTQHANLYPAASKAKENEAIFCSKNGIKAAAKHHLGESDSDDEDFENPPWKKQHVSGIMHCNGMALSSSKLNGLNTHLPIHFVLSSSTSVHKSSSKHSASTITQNDFTSNGSFNGSLGPATAKLDGYSLDANVDDEAMELVQIIFNDEPAEVALKRKKATIYSHKRQSEVEIDGRLDSGNESEQLMEDSGGSSSESEEVSVPKRRLTVSGAPTTPAVISVNEENLNNWLFEDFFEGSPVDVNANGELWICDTKSHVVVLDATKKEMVKIGLWGKPLVVGKKDTFSWGAASKQSFIKRLPSQKDSLIFINYLLYNFNIENLQWSTHKANMLMKLSNASVLPSGKYSVNITINRTSEHRRGYSMKLEARHEVLQRWTHLYKSTPSHKRKPQKSKGSSFKLVDWAEASDGLKNAVELSGIPFDNVINVLVHYNRKEVNFKTNMDGYVQCCGDSRIIGVHCIILGFTAGDSKIARHRVDGLHGKLDNCKRVLRPGNCASNGSNYTDEQAAVSIYNCLEHIDHINTKLESITELNEFKRRVTEEVEKIKKQ
ncbi:hypothetical protein BJ741DRAFT_583715 [Chytriomyces cf. hyalinus JEL632]|nr:hypothetical protein BJ741DRAFT_583715 [Chytriomyces cf. hyalinus JEL632]